MPTPRVAAPLESRCLFLSSSRAVLVDDGTVDLFLVPVLDAGRTGAREYLFSVLPGQLLLLPKSPDLHGYRIIAVPAMGAKLHRIVDLNSLVGALRSGALADVASMFDEMMRLLGRLETRQADDGDTLIAGPGRYELPAGRPVALEPGVTGWIEVSSGALLFDDQWEALEGSVFPNMPRHRFKVTEDARIAWRTSAEMVASRDIGWLLQCMEDALLVFLREVIRQRRENAASERVRIRQRAEANTTAMNTALHGFASVIHAGPGRHGHGPSIPPLFQACSAVGESLGARFTLPTHGSGGSGALTVRDIARASGFRTRIVTLRGDWWRSDCGPLLCFHGDQRRPVALLPNGHGGYLAARDDGGPPEKVDAAFVAELQVRAYSFYTGVPQESLTMGAIGRFLLSRLRRELKLIILVGLGGAALSLAVPVLTGLLFSVVLPSANRVQLASMVGILLAAAFVGLLLDASRAFLTLRMEALSSEAMSAAVWDRLLRLPVDFFRQFSAGDLTNRVDGINGIREALAGSFLSATLGGLFSVMSALLMLAYSPTLALICHAQLLAYAAAGYWFGRCAYLAARSEAHVAGTVAGRLFEYLGGVSKLRVVGAESRAFLRWSRLYARQRQLVERSAAFNACNAVLATLAPTLSLTVTFAVAGHWMRSSAPEALSAGAYVAFCSAWSLLLGSGLAFVRVGTDLAIATSLYERADPVLKAATESDASKRLPGTLTGHLELHNVHFSYDAEVEPILRGVSFEVREGEFLAIVGPSGSGKSTLLRLLLGFEAPSRGAIYFNRQKLGDLDIREVRRQIGTVLQNGKLAAGDIQSNIIGTSGLPLEAAWEAARACGLDQDILAMPMGMHTLVSDGAPTLSGGQRQRLLIARAIVNRPRILLFDEATSALDNQTQAIVSKSLEALRATRIVIAHRLSTIMNADRILVIDKGQVVQSGTFQDLMAQAGLFRALARKQTA